MKLIKLLSIYLFSFLLPVSFVFAQANISQQDCYTILVGKQASVDGSVMMAHNEDDYGTRIVNWYKVPAEEHDWLKEIDLVNGGLLRQVPRTKSYLWLEMPEMEFSDSFLNDHGVMIVSNSCPSKEDNPDLIKGGIGYYLRVVMAQRARSAKHAVKIAGLLIEHFGYSGSGRSYCIADPNEAWVLAVVNGKHWVAQRVPDDKVVVIPNYYTIEKINLHDTANFLGSNDIITHALRKGWYDVDRDGEFNFRLAYGAENALKHPGNISRKWQGVNMLAKEKFQLEDEFPFAIEPKQNVSLQMLAEVCRSHYEGTELDKSELYTKGNPHEVNVSPICSPTTQYCMIGHLRSELPVEIGAVAWIAPYRPCVHPFVPWYSGITKTPGNYYRENYQLAGEKHFTPDSNLYVRNNEHAYWTFIGFAEHIDEDYLNRVGKAQKKSAKFENKLFKKQEKYENKVLKLYVKDKKAAIEELTNYTDKNLQRVFGIY